MKCHFSQIRRLATLFLEALQSLFLYGAAGLVALGCYLNPGMSGWYFPTLWLVGGLFVYNLDRLIPDPADQINHPRRNRFTTWRRWLLPFCLLTLIGLPALRHDWLILGMIVLALAVSSSYSLVPPLATRRIKDFPLLKWTVPPAVIVVTLTAPTWLDRGFGVLENWPALAGVFAAILINLLFFDQRDRKGDLHFEVRTVANRLSDLQLSVLMGVLVLLQGVCIAIRFQPELLVFAIYTVSLILWNPLDATPGFHEWAVDGLLFVPLIAKVFLSLFF